MCQAGWEGADCGLRVCPRRCSGRGLCLASGKCECDHGYGGDDCGTSTLPPSLTPPVETLALPADSKWWGAPTLNGFGKKPSDLEAQLDIARERGERGKFLPEGFSLKMTEH